MTKKTGPEPDSSSLPPFAVVIMAGGKGKRMKSELPKVLHLLGGKPLVSRVVATAKRIQPEKIVVVVGYRSELVVEALKGEDVSFAFQEDPLGTAHAVSQARRALDAFQGLVVVLSGDVPLTDADTLLRLIRLAVRTGSVVSLLTAEVDDPVGYGRIIRTAKGDVAEIVEERDADETQKTVREINGGIYVFDAGFLFDALEKVRPDNDQKEFYLTDIVKIALSGGRRVTALKLEDVSQIAGVNRPEELDALNRRFSTLKGERCQA